MGYKEKRDTGYIRGIEFRSSISEDFVQNFVFGLVFFREEAFIGLGRDLGGRFAFIYELDTLLSVSEFRGLINWFQILEEVDRVSN